MLDSSSVKNNYLQVLDVLSTPYILVDPAQNILVWNKATIEYTGIVANDVLSRTLDDILIITDSDFTKLKNATGNKSIKLFGLLRNKQYEIYASRLTIKKSFIGYLLQLGELINSGSDIRTVGKEVLMEMIDRSPFYVMLFNQDGSIFYSNNAFKKPWGLSDENIDFFTDKYNIFSDSQIEKQGLMSTIRKGFDGLSVEVPMFKYLFNAKENRKSEDYYWLIASMFSISDPHDGSNYIVINLYDLTKQVLAENVKNQYETRMELAIKGGELGTWDWDLTKQKLVYNDRWAKMFGYDLGEAYRLTWENMLHPDDKEAALNALNMHVAGKTDFYEAEYRIKTKEGQWKWILDRGKVVDRGKNGKALRMSGTHSDIDQLKANEAILRESEEKYRLLTENAPIGIMILQEGEIVYSNKYLAEMLGMRSFKELLGKEVLDFLPDHRKAAFQERSGIVFEQPNDGTLMASDLRRLNGEQFPVEIVSIPVNFKGKPAMQSLVQDISERKQTEDSLTRNRKMLAQLFNNAPIGIVMLDTNFDVIQINSGFEAIFGYREEELIGHSISEFIVEPEMKQESDSINKSTMEGKVVYCETVRVNKSGERIHVLIYAIPVRLGSENIGIYGIYVDITERIIIEEELKTRNLELDNFVYKVSHDLRAPLASILGLINLTKIESNIHEKETYLLLIERQVQRLDDFIHDVLSHSKNLKMSVVSDRIDFKAIIDKCFSDLSYLKYDESIAKKVTINDDDFHSDQWRIGEIFRNMISNSIKYHDPEKTDQVVEVTVTSDENECIIQISDNGVGIPESRLTNIFEMFYRGTESSDGSGIGLYIVQKAVEKLSGTIQVTSEVLKGTIFNITLPNLKNAKAE